MLARPFAAVVLVTILCAGAAAQTPDSAPVVRLAIRAGEITGAALACGLPKERLMPLGIRVIEAMLAGKDSEAELARARYEEAFRRGIAQVKSGQRSCPDALRAVDGLERELPSPGRT